MKIKTSIGNLIYTVFQTIEKENNMSNKLKKDMFIIVVNDILSHSKKGVK